MPDGRVFGGGTFALELGGAPAGFLLSVAGGEAYGTVAEERPLATWVPKHLAAVVIPDIVLEANVPAPAPLGSWIKSLFAGAHAPMSGAIVFLDASRNEHERLEWTNGMISEVTFPAADGASKETARVRVTITPETARLVPGSGAPYETLASKQKVVSQSSFRFSLAGLEQASTKVSKVSAIVVTRRATDDVGELRDFEKAGVVLAVSNIVIALSQSELAQYAAWFDEFVIRGICDASHERAGSLTFLDASLKNEVMRIDFGGVGITRITRQRDAARAGAVPQATVELYCETVTLAK